MDESLLMYAIYTDPLDYPAGSIVVRCWEVSAKGNKPKQAKSYPSVEAARDSLPKGLTNIGRHECDDPTILEVWL